VSPVKISWLGKSLQVNFNLQYNATDGGSQQGRILVLARGPQTLLAYPQGVFTRAGSDSLVGQKQGEYFSVSRFREVKADFEQAKGVGQLLDAEILIISLEGEIIFYQKVPIPQNPESPAASKPKDKTASSVKSPAPKNNASSELIEPGVDQ
jgi:hypothetical protein